MKITLNKALRMKKMLDKRIIGAISDNKSIGVIKSGIIVADTLQNQTEFESSVKSNMQSLTDLIAQRDYLSKSIMEKNMSSSTTINNQTFTLSQLLELNKTISYYELLLKKLKGQYADTVEQYERQLEDVEYEANEMLKSRFSTNVEDAKAKKGKDDASALNAYANYKALNEPKLIDPIKLGDKLKELESFVEQFKDDVDSAISDLNATTEIEFDENQFRELILFEF